jgi:Protein of unknown function (DUF4043)
MEHVNTVGFSDYGAGANIPAHRALFLGAHAIGVAYGSSGDSGMRMQMIEDDVDHKEENVIGFRSVAGIKKTRFDGMDFGMMAIDTAYTAVASNL